jgi:hypothetical protein
MHEPVEVVFAFIALALASVVAGFFYLRGLRRRWQADDAKKKIRNQE